MDARRGTPIHRIRIALGRLLVEFQADLSALETGGLPPAECALVKKFLRKAIEVFEKQAIAQTVIPATIYSEVAKHFEKYSVVYHDWNGNEGTDPGKAAARKRKVAELTERRRKLFKKLSARQAEAAKNPQLELFADAVWQPFKELGDFLPERFPRLRQAVVFCAA